MKKTLALFLLAFAVCLAQAPTVIQQTDQLQNSRGTINTNFQNLYTGSAGLIDCSGVVGRFVLTLTGSGGPSVCGTLTWANVTNLSGYPGVVSSFNTRLGAVTLQQSDVSAVEQDLRASATPTFAGVGYTASPFSTMAGAVSSGTGALPWSSIYLGTAATNNIRIIPGATSAARVLNLVDPGTNGAFSFGDQSDASKALLYDLHSATTATTAKMVFAQTATRTYTWPDASITPSGTKAYDCSTSAACSPTNEIADWEFYGSVPLSSASPSQATVTGLSPAFTSSSTYYCTATPQGATATIAAAGIAVSNVSGSSFTLTGPNTVTTVVNFRCRGH